MTKKDVGVTSLQTFPYLLYTIKTLKHSTGLFFSVINKSTSVLFMSFISSQVQSDYKWQRNILSLITVTIGDRQ